MEKFSKKEAIKFGWEIAKKRIKFFVPLLILVFGVSFIFNYLSGVTKKESSLVSFLLIIINVVISTIFNLGLIKIYLKIYDGEEPKFSDLISEYKLFFRYFIALIILVGLIFVSNFLFFIIFRTIFSIRFGFYGSLIVYFLFFIILVILGIIFSIRFRFFGYLIVDKNSKIVESLKKSWQITKGNTLNLFLFYFLLILINALGALALGLGLLLTIPTTMLANAFVYRKLSQGLKVQNQKET